ncbi:MAG TPA: class GN sortase [Bradyrhizobium sp.]|nr:class GN sortase [Bradyrhizobium sp.]
MKRFFFPLPLALAGLILFGQGAYIHAKALLAQVLLQRAFAETIATGRDTKPWSWADTWPVARIEVKRLSASAIVLAGSSGQALAFGPGHVELTANAGERGVAVYSAHRDTHFRFLKDVRIGDVIEVTRRDGNVFRYLADSHSVVRFDQFGIDPSSNEYELVLSTCWPFDAVTPGPDRYLLHATLIGNPRVSHKAADKAGGGDPLLRPVRSIPE